MDNKVSIIVPVYNSAAYVDYCIESLIRQTYKNIEIILVDDGSTDASLQKCMAWKEKHSNIIVLSQENKGQGYARNRGLKNATGDYIAFVDSDDWVYEDYIESMLKTALQNNCELVACSLVKVWLDDDRNIIKRRRINMKIEETGRVEAGDNLYYLHWFSTFLWNKLYKRDLIDRVGIEQACDCVEDMCVSLIYTYYAKGIIYLKKELYVYWQREGSSSYNDKLFGKVCNTFSVFRDNIDRYMPQLREEYVIRRIIADVIRYYRLSVRDEKRALEDAVILRNKFLQTFGEKQNDVGNLSAIIFGSFNIRCIVNELSYFELPYYGFSSLIGLMNEGNKKQIVLRNHNLFRQKMIEAEQENSFREAVKSKEVLFLDFMEERYDVLQFDDGTMLTDSEAVWEADKYGNTKFVKILSGSPQYIKLWKEACDRFVKMLLDSGIKKVVLIRTRLMHGYGESALWEKFDAQEWIEQCNSRMQDMEEYFMARFSDVMTISLEKKMSYTDINYAYGCYPWHMNETAYAHLAKCIEDKWQ